MKEYLTKQEAAEAASLCRKLIDALGGGKLSVADTIRKAAEVDTGKTEVNGEPLLEVTKDGRIFCGSYTKPIILFEHEVKFIRVEEFSKESRGDVMYCYFDGPANHHKGNFIDMEDPEFDFYPDPDSDWYDTVGLLFCDLCAGKRPEDFKILNAGITAKDVSVFWGDGDSTTDLGNDFVDIYENLTGLSAYIWEGEKVPVKDKDRPMAVVNRPEEFDTCGFTHEYDDWAFHKIAEAMRRGFTCVQYIREFVTAFPAPIDDAKITGWD